MYISKAEFEKQKTAARAGISKTLTTDVTVGRRLGSDEPVGDVTDVRENVSLVKFIRGVHTGDWKGAEVEKGLTDKAQEFFKALGTDHATLGGVFVPDQVMATVIPKLQAKAVVRNLEIQRIGNLPAMSQRIPWENGVPTVSYGTENATMTADTGTSYGERVLEIHRAHILIELSREILEYSNIDIEGNVRSQMGRQVALDEDVQVFEGLGGQRPTGIYYHPRVISTDLSAAIAADDIAEATFQLRNADGEGASAWVMAPKLAYKLAILKDANGRYIFSPNGTPLSGKSVTNLDGVPVKQTTKIPITNRPSTNETYTIAANWNRLILGEGPYLIETTTEGGDAFKKHQMHVKLVRWWGFLLEEPAEFCVIKGASVA